MMGVPAFPKKHLLKEDHDYKAFAFKAYWSKPIDLAKLKRKGKAIGVTVNDIF